MAETIRRALGLTRKEQIDAERTRRYGDSESAAAYGQRMGFKAGANWADKNPKWENDDDPLHHKLVKAYAGMAILKLAISEAKCFARHVAVCDNHDGSKFQELAEAWLKRNERRE